MKHGLSRDWMLGTKDCKNYSTCQKYHLNGSAGPLLKESNEDCDLCSITNYSQLSPSSTMSRNFTPTFVYQRRRPHKNHISRCSVASQDYMVSFIECASEDSKHLCEENKEDTSFFDMPESGSEEALISDEDRAALNCVNGNCSSSKSNLEIISGNLKIDVDDLGECSSSGVLIAQKVLDEISELDICISILRSEGLLDRVLTKQDQAVINTKMKNCSKPCKVCEHLESTLNLLICDNCEDAFHTSCCNPHVTRIPVGEWLCTSCLKKKHKMLAKSTNNSVTGTSEVELGRLDFLFRDTEPYMSNARIGDSFQANVPNWRGPVEEGDSDLIADPLELDASSHFGMQELNPAKLSNLGSIGNWLQCKEVIDGFGGDDEILCGKWRRASIFEVQTGNWNCFSCILWDPAHADCAVPQELDTKEVMKQLKYIKMLRPRLAVKKRKLDSSKIFNSQDPVAVMKRNEDKIRKTILLVGS